MSQPMRDQALLRRFEPVLRFTQGERFFPVGVEPYVKFCSLWVQQPDEAPRLLVPAEQLDLQRLAHPYADEFGTIHYLRLIEPFEATRLILNKPRREPSAVFQAGLGRLARVGYGSRMIDALFSLALLTRGRVPGDTAAAAAALYDSLSLAERQPIYYGRVIHESGWIVLQYWFFYLFNNWRSAYFGANDHEADWEMCCLYLSQAENGDLQPEWVAYASHDYAGDDLRRHWLDPEVQKVGEHPVIYVGAGSHASYFQAGEYLTEIELPFLAPLVRAADRMQRFWQQRLRQYSDNGSGPGAGEFANIFRIPFVDYARGDGLALGPEQALRWGEPCLLDPPPPWITQYRGLWGLFTQDPFAGEDAPAGPMYNRDGSVRRAWYDPVGWAGLDKVPSLAELADQLRTEQTTLRAQQQQLWQEIKTKTELLQGLGVRAAAMRSQPHLFRLYNEVQHQINQTGQTLDTLRRQVASGQALLDALELYTHQVRTGDPGPLRAHLRRAHRPTTEAHLRFSRLAEFWAAISIGLVMVVIVGLVVFGRSHLLLGLLAALMLFTLIEASFRGRIIQLITGLTVSLSMVAMLVIVYEFFWQLVILLVLATGAFILWENLREVWS